MQAIDDRVSPLPTSRGSWFFTVNLVERHGNRLLTDHIDGLRAAFRHVKRKHPFTIDAVVILPDHLHCIWTLPDGDTDFSTRWGLIKAYFSRQIPKGERISQSRASRGERGLWQRRFWEHLIRDEADYRQHMDYIHWNPVKHGWVRCAKEWPHSSYHYYVTSGVYAENWGNGVDLSDRMAGE